MNTNRFLLILLAIFLVVSCEKSDIEHENAFERSYQAWLDFKAVNNDSYRSEVVAATWAVAAWSTTIAVREGQVVQRDFNYTQFEDQRMPDSGWNLASATNLLANFNIPADEYEEREARTLLETLQWTETEASLGIHEQTPASAIQTLDDIYETARTVWLKKRNDADISFEAKNNGMISTAGLFPYGCVDDCVTGISIRLIETID